MEDHTGGKRDHTVGLQLIGVGSFSVSYTRLSGASWADAINPLVHVGGRARGLTGRRALLYRRAAAAEEETAKNRPLHDWRAHKLRPHNTCGPWRHGARTEERGCSAGADEV
ncbi:hypothetical protein GJAV_G00234040 [Gymnothorax javanicus]|nr:hypothetical protein GJAV_G00234040 [Gymnothorax javanicus]